jgi:hypothetical protein
MAKEQTSKSDMMSELTKAFVEAIELTRPEAKKTISTRVQNTPWTPKDGSSKLKLKRKMYQHGLLIDALRVTNEEITLLNKLKPGVYMNGWVKVIRRKDRGIDIDYPIKTASQRLRLINEHGVINFRTLLEKIVDEAKNPKKLESEEVEDDN